MKPRPPRMYRRLPGRGTTPVSRLSVWQGPDHLLCIENTFYLERYRRFFYRDIESIVIQPDLRYRTYGLCWAIPAGCALVLVLFNFWWALLAAPLLLGTAVHFALGPTCRVALSTRVSRETMRCWNRTRTARRAVARLLPLVRDAQGAFSAEGLAAAAAAPPAGHPGEPTASGPIGAAAAARPLPVVPPRVDNGLVHRLVCLALWVEALAAALAMLFPMTGLFVAQTAVACALFFLVVTALIRQGIRHLAPAVRKWTWGLFVWQMARGIVGYAWAMARMIGEVMATGPGSNATDDWVIRLFTDWLHDSPFMTAMTAVGGIVSFLLGAIGAALLRQRAPPQPPPFPAASAPRNEAAAVLPDAGRAAEPAGEASEDGAPPAAEAPEPAPPPGRPVAEAPPP